MYGEDADLAARARKAGYHPAITPDAVIVHHVGASSLSVEKREMTLRCRVALARKHWSPKRAEAAVMLLQAGTGLRALGANVARSSGLDLARRVAPAPRLARRLRLSDGEAERREVDLRRPPQHEVRGCGRDGRRELEAVAGEAGAHDGALAGAVDDRRLARRQRVAAHVGAAHGSRPAGPGEAR